MFLFLPLRFRDPGHSPHVIPLVNGLLVVFSVLIYWLDWGMPVGSGTSLISVLMGCPSGRGLDGDRRQCLCPVRPAQVAR